MRDVKELYSELLASCSEAGNINTDAFSKHLEDMDPAERKVLLAWVFNTLAKAVGAVFTKAANIIGDALDSPYTPENNIHVINLTKLFSDFVDDRALKFIYEAGLKDELAQVFVRRQWPSDAASFAEVFTAVSEQKITISNRPGNELLILGSYESIVNTIWEEPDFGDVLNGVMKTMGYGEDLPFPGYITVWSNRSEHTGKVKVEPANE